MGALIGAADTGAVYFARFLATVLVERAFQALRLLEGSSLPEGRCIPRQQSSFSVQFHTERGLLLQHCLKESKAVAWSMVRLTNILASKAPAEVFI